MAKNGLAIGRNINSALKRYVGGTDWKYAKQATSMHRWADCMNAEFDLDIETPAIQVQRMRTHTLGLYECGRGPCGLEHTLRINSDQLDLSEAEQLVDLLVLLLHEWQALHGRRGGGPRLLANQEFRDKAESLGLLLDRRGRLKQVTPGPFIDLLRRNRVDVSTLDRVRPKNPGQSRMKKWICACSSFRAAKEMDVTCNVCRQPFRKVEPS